MMNDVEVHIVLGNGLFSYKYGLRPYAPTGAMRIDDDDDGLQTWNIANGSYLQIL